MAADDFSSGEEIVRRATSDEPTPMPLLRDLYESPKKHRVVSRPTSETDDEAWLRVKRMSRFWLESGLELELLEPRNRKEMLVWIEHAPMLIALDRTRQHRKGGYPEEEF